MTGSISTYGQFLRTLSSVQRVQGQQQEIQTQTGTGKKGNTIGDYGAQGQRLLNLRGAKDQLETYKLNIADIGEKGAVMDTAMGQMGDLLDKLEKEYLKVEGNLSTDTTFLNDMGKRGLEQLTQLLNSKVGGRYVFAASDVDTPPVQNLGGLTSKFESLIDTGSDADSIIAAMKSAFTDSAQAYQAPDGTTNDAVFSSSLQFAGSPLKVRVDVNRDIQYGVRADDKAFTDMLRTFAMAATIKYTPDNQDQYDALVTEGHQAIKDSRPALLSEIGQLGVTRKQVDDLSVQHEHVIDVLDKAAGNIDDVDYAALATKMSSSTTALEATYKILASMQQMSLVNYIS